MKRIAYSFLLVTLLSCGTHSPSSHNRITLQFRDSIIKDFYLLSVRDSSLVVAPYQTGEIEMHQLIAESQNIRLDMIERIFDKGDHDAGSILFPSLAGGLLGGCAT